MNILMLSSESVPFSKSGGLADVVGALSSALALSGNEVSIFMPLYGSIDSSLFKETASFEVPLLAGTQTVHIMEAWVGKVRYLALAHPFFTERKGIYGDTSFTPYHDNCVRYLLMCKAAVEWAAREDVDILHCHDWTAGPATWLAKQRGLHLKSVFTIHNLAYMGEFARYDVLQAAIPVEADMLMGDGLSRRFNMLKCGLLYADWITTVSPTYAQEIQGAAQGCGMDWLLRQRSDRLSGVINGIDMDEWDPSKDAFFNEHFSAVDLSGKAALKARVQELFKLPVEADTALVAMISRLAEQKGFDTLLAGRFSTLEALLTRNKCQFIILGTGDKRYEDKLKEIASRHDNISVNIVFSQELSHLVEGAADFFLMPSHYEPCGLNQMYSLRYGTLPIAHRTGGLADTIRDIRSEGARGDGFLFENVYSDEIQDCFRQAMDTYQDKEALHQARVNGMAEDFSWARSASQYEDIYRKAKALGGNKS